MAQPEQSKSYQLGRYLLTDRLGTGPLGTTYRAKDTTTDDDVAVKVLHPALAQRAEFVKQLHAAVRRMRGFEHPALAKYLDADTDRGHVFIVHEYVDGTPLNKALAQGKLTEKTALTLGTLVTSFLQAADSAGLVHGRIKPANLIVTRDKRIKLTDAGLPRPEEPATGDEAIARALLDEARFLAPEQIRSEGKVGSQADLYSLGAVLWYALTGRVPFDGDVPGAVLAAHLTRGAESPRSADPSISPAASELVMTLLATDPSARYAGPADLHADLGAVLAGRAPQGGPAAKRAMAAAPSPAAAAAPSRAPVLYALSGVVFLLAAYVFVMALKEPAPRRTAPPPRTAATPAATPVVLAEPTAAPAGDRETLANQALEEADRFAMDNPEETVKQLEMYRSVISTYPGTMAAAKARKKREALQQGLPSDFEVLLAKMKEEAAKHEELYQFGDAVKLFNNPPPALRRTEFDYVLEEEAAAVQQLARTTFEQIKSDAEEQCEQNNYSAAKQMAELALSFGMDKITDGAEALLSQIEELELKYQQEEQQKRAEQYDTFRRSLAPVLAARNFDAALAQMQTALDDPEMERIHPWVEADLRDLNQLRDFWQTVIAGLASLKGKPSPLPKFRGTVTDVKDESIQIGLDNDAGEVVLVLSRLNYTDVDRLLEQVIDTRPAQTQAHLALLQMSLAFYDNAEDHIEKAKKAGHDVTGLEETLARLSSSYDRINAQEAEAVAMTPEEAEARAASLVRALRRNLRCTRCGGSGELMRTTRTTIRTRRPDGQPWRSADEFGKQGGIKAGHPYYITCPNCRGLKFFYNTTTIDNQRAALQRIIDRYADQLPLKLLDQCNTHVLLATVARAFKLYRKLPYDAVVRRPQDYMKEFYYITGRYDGTAFDEQRQSVLRMRVTAKRRGGEALEDPMAVMSGREINANITVEWTDTIEVLAPRDVPSWLSAPSGDSSVYIAVCAQVVGVTENRGEKTPRLRAIYIDKARLFGIK